MLLLTNAKNALGLGEGVSVQGARWLTAKDGGMCLRYDFRNQNSARIGINLLPNVIKLFSDRTCIFHARSFAAQRGTDSALTAWSRSCVLTSLRPTILSLHSDFLLLLRYLILLILIEIYVAGPGWLFLFPLLVYATCCCCWYCCCCCCCCYKYLAYFRLVADKHKFLLLYSKFFD